MNTVSSINIHKYVHYLNSNNIALANVSKLTWSFKAPACLTCPNIVMPIIA